MAGFQGRQRQWDFTLNDYPFTVLRGKFPNGISWDVPRQPDVAGEYQSVQAKPRAYRSTHSGFGWGQFLVDNVYHYATNLDCFLPSTPVTSLSPVLGAARRWYDGEVIHLTTASGHQITATPNHPILTDRGWVGLGLLQEGDNVARYVGSDRMPLRVDDVQYVDTAISEVFDLSLVGGSLQRVVGKRVQFHGDGQESNVDIVSVNGLLPHRVKANSTEPLHQLCFSLANLREIGLKRECLIDSPTWLVPIFKALAHAGGHSITLLLRHSRHLHLLSFGLGPEPDTILGKNPINNLVRNIVALCQCVSTHPSHIFGNNHSGVVDRLALALAEDSEATYWTKSLHSELSGFAAVAKRNVCVDENTFDARGTRKPIAKRDSLKADTRCVAADNIIGIQEGHLSRSYLDTIGSQQGTNAPMVDVEALSKAMGTLPGSIVLDKIIRINRSRYCGHVYNLHTQSNWYLADAIISHNCRFPQQIIMGPLVSTVTLSSTDSTNGVTGIFEYGTSLYTISGKWVNKINPSTDAVAATGGFPYDLTTGNAGAIGTVGVRFDANVVIDVTTASTANMVSFDGTSTFTVLSGANVPKGAYLARYYEDTDWRLATVFLSSSNPSVAWIAQGAALNTGTNWAGYDGSYGVGDQGGTLTGLTALERTLYIGMSDGLYYIDRSGRAPLLIPAMPTDSGNGKNLLATAEGVVWYPCKSGLYLYDPNSGTIDNVAPGRGLPDRSGIAGTYTALANFRAWTFVSVYDGTDSYIMAGRRREEGEPGFGPYIWHGALAKISSTEVKSMHVSALVSPPRLWMGLKSGNVVYIKLPGNGDNPLLDSTYRYAASGSIYFGADDWGIGGMKWGLQDVIVEAEGLSANTTVAVYRRLDLGSWTQIGSTITSSGRTVITPTTDLRFQRCELRLDLVNDSSTSTPVVRVLGANALPRPSMRDVIQTTVILDDQELSRLGIQSRYSAQNLADQLDIYDSGPPYTLKHHWSGTEVSKTVYVVSARKHMVRQEGDNPAIYVADLVLKVVA